MRLAAYARFSSDNQRDLSIVAQLRAINEFAAREGHTIVKVYQDQAKSATTDDRPEFLNLMRDITSGHFDAIIVHKLDRFARDRYDAAYYRKTMRKHGIKLMSVIENLDDSPESVMFEAIIEGMNEYYSRNLAREVMKGMKETAYQCKHTGGMPPLGYDVAPDKSYIVNEKEAEAVRIIFDMYAAGEGYSAILAALNDNGYRTKSGKLFAKNSLNSILNNEKYTGVYTFNKYLRKVDGRRNSRKEKPQDEVIRVEGGIPAIIDQAAWNSVRVRMDDNRHAHAASSARTVYLLSGKIFCGKCGASMIGKHGRTGRNKDDYAYYECGTRRRTKSCDMKAINRDFVESQVIEMLKRTLFDPDVIDAAAERIFEYSCSRDVELPQKIRGLKTAIAGIEVEIRNIVNAVAAGMFHESMKDKLTDLETRKAALNMDIAEKTEKMNQINLSKDDIKLFLARWSNISDKDEYKQAIRIFIERVVVYDDYIDIDIFTPQAVVRTGVVPSQGAARLHHEGTTAYRQTVTICIIPYRHNAKKPPAS